ncbi:MAG: hypothetical protein EOO01_30895, partial [Chitinophagaceae bacterium]
QYMHNVLHLNHGNGFFSDVSQMAGVAKTEWSWATLLCDFDNDGNRDIFVANGYRRDLFDGDIQQKQEVYVRANMNRYKSAEDMFEKGYQDFMDVYDPIKVRNYLFKNKGGLQFENVSEPWGFADSTFSNGAAVADFDNDGDLDLVINNLDGESDLYENLTGSKNNYLRIKLEGPRNNPDGIGAKVSVYYDGKLQQFFQQKLVRGYLSSNEPTIHFGLGKENKIDSVLIAWQDGKINKIEQVPINKVATLAYKTAVPGPLKSTQYAPLFASVTNEFLPTGFVHKESRYDEYADQILLPHEFARSGPSIATGDVNGDGAADFFIGGAKDQPGSLYISRNGFFEMRATPIFVSDRKFEDMGAMFFDADADGDSDLYVVSGGSEFNEGSEMYQDRLYINDGRGNFSRSGLPKTSSSGSSVTTFDFDGDGDLDIFRGGEVVAHQYPQSPESYLFVNEKGRFVDKTKEIAHDLARAGMIKSST